MAMKSDATRWVALHAGVGASVSKVAPTEGERFGWLGEVSAELLGDDIQFFGVRDATDGQHFALPDVGVLAMNEDYIASAEQVRHLLIDDAPSEDVSAAAYRLALRQGAFQLLRARDTIRSIAVMARFLLVEDRSSASVSRSDPRADDSREAAAAFAVAHEVGHLSAFRGTRDFQEFPLQPIERAIAGVGAESLERGEGSRAFIERLLTPRDSLRAALFDEVYADVVAARLVHPIPSVARRR